MAYGVAWSPRAVEDLEAIAQYIAADSAAYAAAVVKTILHTERSLSQFPRAGRVQQQSTDSFTSMRAEVTATAIAISNLIRISVGGSFLSLLTALFLKRRT